jgi:hypothetical protein
MELEREWLEQREYDLGKQVGPFWLALKPQPSASNYPTYATMLGFSVQSMGHER